MSDAHAMIPGMTTMRDLMAHAAHLGVEVHVAHLPRPYLGYYDADTRRVILGFNLPPARLRAVFAHELGHAFYDHHAHGDHTAERRADEYAAGLLIDPATYAAAEQISADPEYIADELDVPTKIVRAYQSHHLERIGTVTYTRARMGVGQWRHRSIGA